MKALLVIVLLTGSAYADKAIARQQYEHGLKQYNLGEYQTALEAFTKAYDEFPDPILLFNLGQCNRQLGNKQKAITLFRSYLRESEDAANADEVRRLVAALEEELRSDRAAKPDSVVEPAPPSATPVAAPPVTAAISSAPVAAAHPTAPRARRPKRWVIGVGVAAGVVTAAIVIGLSVGLTVRDVPPIAGFGTTTVH